MKRVGFYTLGCKVNYAESACIAAMFQQHDFELTSEPGEADVWIINTCSVTENADRECRQLIRRIHRKAPDAFVIVTGCYAQLQPERVASLEGVDAVLGSREKSEIFELISEFKRRDVPLIAVSPHNQLDHFWLADSSGFGERTRAFLKIQDGCDYNCSFCVIPQARGTSRSEPVDNVIIRARSLIERGYKEIVLTGVNVGDYGRKIGGSLYDLLCKLDELEGLQRLRISSIEPNLLTDEIIKLVAHSEKICPHFHIPLQSGSDTVLARMRRRYKSVLYRDRVETILSYIPHAGIGVDVIVGFPGETEREFEETYRFLSDLPVSYFHVFSYSVRQNTPAASMGGVVSPQERERRSRTLRALGVMKRRRWIARYIGDQVSVLLEGDYTDDGAFMHGFTPNYMRVRLPAQRKLENEIVTARIVGLLGDVAQGTFCPSEDEVLIPQVNL